MAETLMNYANGVITAVENPLTIDKKLAISAVSGLIFLVASLPQTYAQTSRFVTTMENGCYTSIGHISHAVIYALVVYLLMKIGKSQGWYGLQSKSDLLLAKYVIFGALLFFAVSSTDVYRLTNSVLGGDLSNDMGCPTTKGIVIHAITFSLLMIILLNLPHDAE